MAACSSPEIDILVHYALSDLRIFTKFLQPPCLGPRLTMKKVLQKKLVAATGLLNEFLAEFELTFLLTSKGIPIKDDTFYSFSNI